MNISSLYGNILPVSGNFGDLSVFDFSGVYILYNENQEDEIVYIGSSYSRKIKKRLISKSLSDIKMPPTWIWKGFSYWE